MVGFWVLNPKTTTHSKTLSFQIKENCLKIYFNINSLLNVKFIWPLPNRMSLIWCMCWADSCMHRANHILKLPCMCFCYLKNNLGQDLFFFLLKIIYLCQPFVILIELVAQHTLNPYRILCIFGSFPISWWTKRQKIVSLSLVEA